MLTDTSGGEGLYFWTPFIFCDKKNPNVRKSEGRFGCTVQCCSSAGRFITVTFIEYSFLRYFLRAPPRATPPPSTKIRNCVKQHRYRVFAIDTCALLPIIFSYGCFKYCPPTPCTKIRNCTKFAPSCNFCAFSVPRSAFRQSLSGANWSTQRRAARLAHPGGRLVFHLQVAHFCLYLHDGHAFLHGGQPRQASWLIGWGMGGSADNTTPPSPPLSDGR